MLLWKLGTNLSWDTLSSEWYKNIKQLRVNSTSNYTLLTLYRFYFKGVNTSIELQVYDVTCGWPYLALFTVNSTSDYTLWTLYRSHFKSISASFELQVWRDMPLNLALCILKRWGTAPSCASSEALLGGFIICTAEFIGQYQLSKNAANAQLKY
jgi:hypothetical protein